MTRYPDDLPEEERAKCRLYEILYGTSFIELTDDGPRGRAPTEVTLADE